MDLGRQYDPVLLKNGFQFYFIKKGCLQNSVPHSWPVTLIQSVSTCNPIDVHLISSWLCCYARSFGEFSAASKPPGGKNRTKLFCCCKRR
jgi:hypothetical protein